MTPKTRAAIATLTLSVVGFVGVTLFEGFEQVAKPPVPGDVPTYGYGTTTHPDGTPVKTGEKITVMAATGRALADIARYEGAIKRCVKVPLYQHEYDAFVSLAYNIGTGAFCRSTLVRKLNALDYAGACREILRWDRFKGARLRGLTLRRQKEYKQCTGGQDVGMVRLDMGGGNGSGKAVPRGDASSKHALPAVR